MHENNKIYSSDLTGIYEELAELLNVESAIKIYEHFKGQQVSFPMRLYTKDYIVSQITTNNNQSVKKSAVKYGYSERRLRQIIKEGKEEKNA